MQNFFGMAWGFENHFIKMDRKLLSIDWGVNETFLGHTLCYRSFAKPPDTLN